MSFILCFSLDSFNFLLQVKSLTELSQGKSTYAGKFLCFRFALLTNTSRSRAFQISMNLTVIEEWIEETGLPAGVQVHFAPVRDLLNWLQVG